MKSGAHARVVVCFPVISVAQESPKIEVPTGFSLVNVQPDLTTITSFNLFGGGGGFAYNVIPIQGI
jgi:hypothetical protein